MNGKVWLVGAGCGEHDLITLRGKRLIERCDALVYDALIDSRLIAMAPAGAEKISVGKRAGKHSAAQEDINALLISLAGEGKNVVRLKGGDPFVFGRGGEEAEAMAANGIEYGIVPGISSCIAAPECAGIPVTHRGTARSFHVITAHTSGGTAEFSPYASLEGTLVFLMGLSSLGTLSRQLIAGGKDMDTPAAVVSKGGTPQQRAVRGTLSDIAQKAEGLEAPAVIVVGQTAALDFHCTPRLPLSGTTVALTGTKAFAGKLAEKLQSLGAQTFPAAQLDIEEKELSLPELRSYSWLVLTSSAGVEALTKRLKQSRTDLRALAHLKLAAVGRATAEALEEKGLYPELVPESFTSEALAKELSGKVGQKERVLIIRAAKGSERLTEILSGHGIEFADIKAYDTAARLLTPEVSADFIVFASAYGAESFFKLGGSISEKTKPVCIGEVTASALERAGINGFLTAEENTADGIVKLILKEERE